MDGSTDGDVGVGPLPMSRRNFLRLTAGSGAVATGIGGGLAGTAAASDVPTPWLRVEGNRVLDPNGNALTLRGVNTADPKRLNVTAPARGKNAEQVVTALTDTSNGWYPRMIRLPVQPVDIGEHPPGQGPEPVAFTRQQLTDYLATHLDPVIDHCEQRNVYAIVDYHRHRDVQWDDPDLDTEVRMFWDVVAPRYADRSHVIYEVYNEPTQPGIWGDPTTDSYWAGIWSDWVDVAQPWVDVVRAGAPRNLVLIGSPSWTQSPEGALVEPFQGTNLAYTYHIYPGHTSSQNEDWEDASGKNNGEGVAGVYETYPLFVTEFGWQSDLKSRYLKGTTSGFGQPFMNWLEHSDAIHWTAWCGDPVWLPAMFDRAFSDTDYANSVGDPYSEPVPEECSNLPCEWSLLTGEDMGGFIKDRLAARKDHGIPVGSGGDGDATAPTVPANLSVTGRTNSSVSLDWDAATDDGSGVAYYVVYLDGSRDHTVSAGTTATTVSGLSSGTSYDVHVTAVDGAGNESGPSNTVTAATTESAPAVDTFSVQNQSNGGWARVQVDWTVSDADGDLTDVTIEFRHGGTTTDAVNYGVSGSLAAGCDKLQDKKGSGTYDVVLRVTDASANTGTQTTTISA